MDSLCDKDVGFNPHVFFRNKPASGKCQNSGTDFTELIEARSQKKFLIKFQYTCAGHGCYCGEHANILFPTSFTFQCSDKLKNLMLNTCYSRHALCVHSDKIITIIYRKRQIITLEAPIKCSTLFS